MELMLTRLYSGVLDLNFSRAILTWPASLLGLQLMHFAISLGSYLLRLCCLWIVMDSRSQALTSSSNYSMRVC